MKPHGNGAKWTYAGGGGHDTAFYSLNGQVRTFPGLKQIWKHGLFNVRWWACYFYRKAVIEKEI